MSVVDIKNINLNVGGQKISGFAEKAISFTAKDEDIKTKKGLDSLCWVVTNDDAKEIECVVTLGGTSPSVKHLGDLARAKVPTEFFFNWKDVGVEVSALKAMVIAPKDLDIAEDCPEIAFTIKLANFTKKVGV